MSGDFDMEGLDAMLDKLDELETGVEDGIREGALVGAQIVVDRARELAPRRTGDMADAIVAVPTFDGAEIQATVPYTEDQEENESYRHPNGGRAHFLSSALEENQDQVLGALGDGVDAAVKRVVGGGS